MRRSRSFTLIEILIVMALLALVGGAIAINTLRALREDRFHASVQRLVDRLQLSQDLMLISGIDQAGLDVFLDVKRREGQYHCKMSFKGDFSERSLRIFVQEFPLYEVGQVVWRQADGVEESDPQLVFRTLNREVPSGVIELTSASRDDVKRYILLKGYPAKISSTRKRVEPIEIGELERESDELYPKEIMLDFETAS